MPRVPGLDYTLQSGFRQTANKPQMPEGELGRLPGGAPNLQLDTRVQPNGLSIYGDTTQKITAMLEERQDAYNKIEGTRTAAITSEQFKTTIRENAQSIADPNEFEAKTNQQLRGLYDSATGTGRRAIDEYAKLHLQPELLSAQRQLGALKFGKQTDQARRGVEDTLETYSRMVIESDDPAQAGDYAEKFGDMIGQAEHRGFLKAEQGGEYARKFGETVRRGREARFNVDIVQGELATIVNNATTGKQSPDEGFKQGVARIDSFQDIPREKRDAAKAKFKDAIWTGAVEGQIEKDPFKADEDLRAGKYNGLIDQQSLRFLKNKSAAEIDRMVRQTDAVSKEQDRIIGKAVDDFKGAVMNGFEWKGNVASLAAAVRGSKHEEEFQHTLRDSAELSTFGLMGPLQQENYLRQKAQTPKDGDEAQLYKKLEGMHEQTKSQLKDDALTYAIRRRAIPNLNAFDLKNPASLRERSIAARLVEDRYGVPASPLSDDEAQALSQELSKAPADKQVAMLQQLRSGLDDRYVKAVAGQLAKKKDDPVLVQAMALSTENPEAASRILRGREIIRDNKEIMPKGAELKTAQELIASTLAEAYKHNPEHYSAVSDAAMAIYAQKSWQARDLTGVTDSKRLQEAIKEASGGVITVGRGWFGGGSTIQPPKPGMTEDQFMDRVRRADYSKAKGFKAADIEKHGLFESIGDGRYMVKIGPGYVQGDSGPFILDLNFQSGVAADARTGGVSGLVK